RNSLPACRTTTRVDRRLLGRRRARLYGAEGLGTDADGKTFIADMRNSRVRLVDALGSIITIVGTGESSGLPVANGTPGVQASAGCPGLAVGPDGRLYYRDLATGAVRVLTLAGC